MATKKCDSCDADIPKVPWIRSCTPCARKQALKELSELNERAQYLVSYLTRTENK